MNEKKYFFKKLCNIEVEKVFLNKSQSYALGLYHNKILVGIMKDVESTFSVKQLLQHLKIIFPLKYSELDRWKRKNKNLIEYSGENLSEYYGLNQKDKYFYFDENYLFTSETESNIFLNKNLWNIEPIVIYLKKSKSFVAGLYKHQYWLGCCLLPTCSISLEQFTPYSSVFFPDNLNDLDEFVIKNTAVSYFYSTDIIRYDEEGLIL